MRAGKKKTAYIFALLWLLVISLMAAGCNTDPIETTTEATTEATTVPTETTQPPRNWQTGFVAAHGVEAAFISTDGMPQGNLLRGTQVEYEALSDGRTELLVGGVTGFLQEGRMWRKPPGM